MKILLKVYKSIYWMQKKIFDQGEMTLSRILRHEVMKVNEEVISFLLP